MAVPTEEDEVREWVGFDRHKATQAQNAEVVRSDGVRPELFIRLTNIMQGRQVAP